MRKREKLAVKQFGRALIGAVATQGGGYPKKPEEQGKLSFAF